MTPFTKTNRGFIALISVLVISFILLGLTAAANTAGFFARFAQLDLAYQQQSYVLAEGCANVALLNLQQNYSYAPTNQQITIGNNACTIVSVTTQSATASSKQVTIQTKAQYNHTFTNLSVTATIQNPSVASAYTGADIVITSWQEIH